MREIKFRAWATWTELSPKMYGPFTIFEYYEDGYDAGMGEEHHFPSNPSTIIMQYTGLKDKNGQEICEGDILLHHHQYGNWKQEPIEWKTMEGLEGLGVVGFEIDQECVLDAEVIGNIYENPELLEGDKK